MTEPSDSPNLPGAPSPAVSGLLGRCPRCGKGHLFQGFLTVKPACEACGLDLRFADSGDGPAVFIMLIAGFIVVGGVLYVETVYEPRWWVHALLWPPIVTGLCLGMLRPLKGLMIALQYANRAEEGRLER